jgi:hypothetical protein
MEGKCEEKEAPGMEAHVWLPYGEICEEPTGERVQEVGRTKM